MTAEIVTPFQWVLIVFVFLGAIPFAVSAVQYLLVGIHGSRNHYSKCLTYFPRTAILIPAWNEALVLGTSIDQLMRLEYPRDRLRLYVVDDASTDDTPAVLAAKAAQYPGSVFHLRREKGGEGKAHTLNHGLDVILSEPWMECLLIMDADVVYEPDSLRKMTSHLVDPEVGAVTAYIKEGSRPANYLNRFVGYEYVTAQAVARRAQNVLGALACLAGGAQLHTRDNLEALGGRVDTSTLAEDTVTTLETQRRGKRVVFEPNATVWAEEPSRIGALWKQRLRWARGNVQVSRRYKSMWFRPNRVHRLGSAVFGLLWFTTLLLPLCMILSSAALVILWLMRSDLASYAFSRLWIVNALCWVFTTALALLADRSTARRSWREAIMFPGIVSVLIMLYACAPRPFRFLARVFDDWTGIHVTAGGARWWTLFFSLWVAGCMVVAYAVCVLERRVAGAGWLIYLVGFGPLLCAITFAAYVQEIRGASQTWDKTEKTGRVGLPA
jgi:cellulose synthase/poly-beta-1,6-N-acetylglucosamine synthase-like glycosyltransferase